MSTPVHVESPDLEALAAIRDHHAELRRRLDEHVTALRQAVRRGAGHLRPLAALQEFVFGQVLPHAAAEETALYPSAATAAPLLIEAMTAEHRTLTGQARALAEARSPVDALPTAEGFAAVFATHVEKESELLLPLLTRTPGVSPAALLRSMHGRPDAGHLGDTDAPPELDVRELPHGGGRHEAIFARLDGLSVGDRLVIVNDHDPRPLRFQLDAAWPDTFGWDYLQEGPQVWRVAVTRQA